MLRIVVRTDDGGMACNVGGAVHTELKTFDIHAPEIERYLAQSVGTYGQRQVVGVERLVDEQIAPGKETP